MRRDGELFALMSTLRMDYLRQAGAYCARWVAREGATRARIRVGEAGFGWAAWSAKWQIPTCFPAPSFCARSCIMEAAAACPVVPQPVQRYIHEVCESLRHIADCEGEETAGSMYRVLGGPAVGLCAVRAAHPGGRLV